MGNIFEALDDAYGKPSEKDESNQTVKQNGYKKDVILIELDKLKDFPNHKFPLYEGERLDALVKSIKKVGILEPLLVMKKGSEMYIILSGHNRKRAGVLAGLKEAPARIFKNLSDEEAEFIVNETNLHQRSFADLTHSQRAVCLAAHYELMKKQGYRTDLISIVSPDREQDKNDKKIKEKNLEKPQSEAENETSRQIGGKLKSSEQAGMEFGLSSRNLERYVRISKLCDTLLKMLDSGQLKFNAAYSLSFIEDKEKQENIAEYIKGKGAKISISDADKLKTYYQKHNSLTAKEIEDVLSKEQLKNKKKLSGIQIKRSIISKYFSDDTSLHDIESTITAALEAYFANTDKEV